MGTGRAYGSKKRPKKSKSSTTVPNDGRPSEEEYEKMEVYKTFVVTSEDDIEFKFEREQIVLILPHTSHPKEQHELPTYWAAKIKDIRAYEFEDKSNSVWARVQWFYSGKDVSDVIKSFDPKAIGPFERIFSDHYDFVQPESFEMVIPMYKLNEVDHEQIYIPKNSFYRRYTFEYLARNLQPKPGLMTCICQKAYNPNDTAPESLMHFCPRPSCRRAYHHRCLMQSKSKESSAVLTVKIPSFSDTQPARMGGGTVKVLRSARKHASPVKRELIKKVARKRDEDEDEEEVARAVIPPTVNVPGFKPGSGQPPSSLSPRALRLLGCSPDTDESLDLRALVYSRNLVEVDSDAPVSDSEDEESDQDIDILQQKRRRGRPPEKGKGMPPSGTSLDSVLETIPSDLLTIAIQPLVRGGAFVAGGVAGNIGMVTKARRLVHTALQMGGGDDGVPDWEDTVFGEDREVLGIGLKNAVVHVTFEKGTQAKKDKGLPPFVCPNCKSAI